jgi:primosomal protein N' (replication factor Y)
MRNIVKVVLTKSTRQYDRIYSYFVPDSLVHGLVPGMRVLVPFGQSNRTVEAVILEVSSSEEQKEVKKELP